MQHSGRKKETCHTKTRQNLILLPENQATINNSGSLVEAIGKCVVREVVSTQGEVTREDSFSQANSIVSEGKQHSDETKH